MEKISSGPETNSVSSEISAHSSLSDYRPQNKSRKTKQVRCKRFKYQNISNELRAFLIQKVIDEKQKIKPTARKLGINYSTAKSILQIYRKEGRVDKKLIPRGALYHLSVEEKNANTESSKSHDLSLNVESERKCLAEQHRYSLRKRDSLKKEERSLSPSKKLNHSSFEPRFVKRVKVIPDPPLKMDKMQSIDSKASDITAATEHTSIQSTHGNSPQVIQMLDVKKEETFLKQGGMLDAPRSFEFRNPAAISNEIQRRMLLQLAMPMLQTFTQQLAVNSTNLVNVDICGLLNQQIQRQASKLLVLAANTIQNAPVGMPVFIQPNPTPNFLFKTNTFDFNARCNFKRQ